MDNLEAEFRRGCELEASMNIYAHGGDVGDLIYGLAAMRTIGKGRLVLHPHDSVRESFTPDKVALLKPLLELQPYLESVEFQAEPPATEWNFNPFRGFGRSADQSLCQCHFRLFGLNETGISERWLKVDAELPIKPVVIARSPRYQNPLFPWQSVFKKYQAEIVFVGLPEEHTAWCRDYGVVAYYPTADYLQLARVIAGARLFIGNQSCPYAMAEAMKVQAILEVCLRHPDCQFRRDNLQNPLNPLEIRLPDL